MTPPPFYKYLEERLLGQVQGRRRKNVTGRNSFSVNQLSVAAEFSPSDWPLFQTRELEGRSNAPLSEGVWPINHWRVERHLGDPGVGLFPRDRTQSQWPSELDAPARLFRLHHYFRITSADSLIRVMRSAPGSDIRLIVKLTNEWAAPKDGVIPVAPPDSVIVGTHAVPLIAYDPTYQMFVFANSWGEEWGHQGFGMLSPQAFDSYALECWCLVGRGIVPRIEASSGLVSLLWKSTASAGEVHGREIVDASTGDRIGWSLAVRRGSFLDIEEFFVWPAFRRRGVGQRLADLIHELARDSGTTLRACVPFADCEPENDAALKAAMRLLGLTLRPEETLSAARIGLATPFSGSTRSVWMPPRPGSMREAFEEKSGQNHDDSSAAQTRLYTVWFGTNRAPNNPHDYSAGFSVDRDSRVHYGQCRVAIPKSHRFGSVGSKWWRRWLLWTDDRLTIADRTGQIEEEFWFNLSQQLASLDEQERHSIVFLHGYNVDFDEAAIRAAQIGMDLKVPGVTAFYSWPSRGTVQDYPVDEASIEASEALIGAFLTRFVSVVGSGFVHLIAHSMGNRGLLRALQRITSNIEPPGGVRFGQIILAAPDMDVALFHSLAHLYPRYGQRTTLYASPTDRAVGCSAWLHGGDRVGLTPPITTAPQIDTIHVPQLSMWDFFGHGYFAEAEPVLRDMFDLIRRNANPKDRQRLDERRTAEGNLYWEISR